jgi:hypothetical protein
MPARRLKANLGPEVFLDAVMKEPREGVPQVGYRMTAGLLNTSRADLERASKR